jgi:Domain of unknown function (DUF1736)
MQEFTQSCSQLKQRKNTLEIFGEVHMSRSRRFRREQKVEQKLATAEKAKADAEAEKIELAEQPAVPRASLWLVLAFLLPNLGALACEFVWDDTTEIMKAGPLCHIHSLRHVVQNAWMLWKWPPRNVLVHYRPVAETLWSILWAVGRGNSTSSACKLSGIEPSECFSQNMTVPVLFHTLVLVAGLAVVLLLYRFLLTVKILPRTAFIAALLFAIFPIHTEATTIATSTEPLAVAFGLGALIFYYLRKPIPALLLFALAILSKESAAAFAALPLAFPRKDWRSRDSLLFGGGAGVIIVAALGIHHALSRVAQISPIGNPIVSGSVAHGILTALWVQCLYVLKALVPITLSADYFFGQIPLVNGLDDWRAWAGLILVSGAVFMALRWCEFRAPILVWAILFSSTANILFPIEVIMGERLAYAPSIGVALLLAILLAQSRHWKVVLVVVALVFGVRSIVRNFDWLNEERFVTKMAETSPNSTYAQYNFGVLRSQKGDDLGAIEAYDRSIAIYPAFCEAYIARGQSLSKLGRQVEAVDSYHKCKHLGIKVVDANGNPF